MSQRKFTIAPVHIERFAIPEHRNHERKSDRCLSGCDHQHEKHKDLSADLSVVAGERNKREVDGVKHDLHRQQQRDDVSLQKETQHSKQE
jgi:hypothetical protein